MTARLFIVDAFTARNDPSLEGNPAGVLITAEPLPDEQAIAIAKKLDLPALALISDSSLFTSDTFTRYNQELAISWLTPSGQWIPLCGHGTMATCLVLFSLHPKADSLSFKSRLGQGIRALRTQNGAEIAFPAKDLAEDLSESQRAEALKVLEKACQLNERDILYLGNCGASETMQGTLFAELDPNVDLASLNVDPNKLIALPYRGLWLTTPGVEGAEDMRTRVFWPKMGIPEDQVCGSAHTFFGPYWASKRGLPQAGDKEIGLKSKQVSPKGGQIGVRWNGQWGPEAGVTWLAGEGKIVDKGTFELDELRT